MEVIGQRYLVVGDSTEFIPVIDAYAYTYDYGNGKTVLRVKIKSNIKTFEELQAMFAEDVLIQMFEVKEVPLSVDEVTDDNKTKISRERTFTFEHFCKDYKCEYNSTEDVFELEITRKTDTELAVEANQSQTLDAYAAVAEIYEM